jgi:butyrate kinase
MAEREPLVLAINPGSGSTKVGLFDGDRPYAADTIEHSESGLARFKRRPILDQLPMRSAALAAWMSNRGIDAEALDAVVGRGGLLPPLPSGTYLVDPCMIALLERHDRGEHASNLGAVLAKQVASAANVEAFVVDPVSVDEWPEHVRLSGHPALERDCLSHALNTKAVGRRYARTVGLAYEQLRLVVAHLGSGISVSAHEDGRMIDVNNSREEGPFSPERSGAVPVVTLVRLCFSGTFDQREVEDMLFRGGGLLAYLGTRDVREAVRRAQAGDERAATVMRALVHQVSREIAAAAAPLRGRVDAILITGGMAHAATLVSSICEHVDWIAQVHVYPGEDELTALAAGALRVLRSEEQARTLAGALTRADGSAQNRDHTYRIATT